MPDKKMVRVIQVNSGLGRKPGQQATLIGLGLNKIGRVKELPDTAQTRGMIARVKHLVTVIESGQK